VSDKFNSPYYGMVKLSTEEEKKKVADDIAKLLQTFEDNIQDRKFFGGKQNM